MADDHPAPRDEAIIQLLRDREGRRSDVVLRDGSKLTVYNIAWGYDLGDTHAHVTTNISPEVEGADADFFFTHTVAAVLDPDSGAVLLAVP